MGPSSPIRWQADQSRSLPATGDTRPGALSHRP